VPVRRATPRPSKRVKTGLTQEDSPGSLGKDRAMALCRLLRVIVAGSALGLAAMAASARAEDSEARVEQGRAMLQGAPYNPPAEARSAWIAECSEGLARSRPSSPRVDRYGYESPKKQAARLADDRRDAEKQCGRYYDDHYEYYNSYRPAQQQAYYQPTRTSSPAGCVPCDRSGRPRSGNCTETVEYEYVDVPVRRATPRPSKRVKTVPDKRIRLK